MNIKAARLTLVLALMFNSANCPALLLGANEITASQSLDESNQSQGNIADFYGQTNLHQLHLDLTAAEWSAMPAIEPQRGAPPVEFLPTGDGGQRAVHRSRFPWAVGSLTMNGKILKGVGIRYKGNASFNLMRGSLKRNLKIKIDWTDEDQRYSGVKTLNLNAGGLDPSKLRDALGYAVFRKAGVPAPRTTFAEVTLTVPGKYSREHLGLFTIVEQVDKSFLKDRFSSKKGLLMKPEGVSSVEYHGPDWSRYESLYRPDNKPLKGQAERVIEFAQFVNQSDDKQFQHTIDSYLDVESFLRFIAVNALIANLDTLLVMPHNYYLHLDPNDNKFVFFPWDLDISFAGWPLGGAPEKQMDLSLSHPHSSDGHKLIDRLFEIDEYKSRYDQIVNELAAEVFSKNQLVQTINQLEKVTRDALTRDSEAIASRKERGYPAPRGYRPPDLKVFVAKRTASIQRQLAGKSTGYVYARKVPPFGRSQLALHILVQGDTNQDRHLSKAELLTLMEQWFDSMDKDKSAQLDKASFVQKLPDALFPPSFPHARPKRGDIPERYVAEGL
ncbi:MAG: CotH kinase family protein, partial [Planctomycetota bacterium]|nr:CotH kinase family protein [Planctomycetota bacterium]